MTLRDRLLKPEYLYRILRSRRLFRAGAGTTVPGQAALVHLPWNLDIAVDPCDALGKALLRLDVYDLVVTEALWRLIRKGDHVVDVGANIGYMTSIMAVRAGESGRTIAFEPHPLLSDSLCRNLALWARNPYGVEIGTIDVRPHAVSERDGEVHLHIPADFSSNSGLAFVVDDPTPCDLPVQCVRLDSAFDEYASIDLLKVDVEGHELAVFRGAERLLSRGQVRDIVFEEHANFPTPVTTFLERFGYTLYQLGVGILGPLLGSGSAINSTPRRSWEPRSMLASREPGTVEATFARHGWRALRAR
jgi:FkbM family methyltransferase